MLQPIAEPRVDNRPRLDEERRRPAGYPEEPAESQQIRRPLHKLRYRGHRAITAGYRAQSAPARIGTKKFVVLVRYVLPFVGINGIRFLARNIGPSRSVFTVEFEPAFSWRLTIRNDRLDRAFRLAHSAIDAFIGMNDQHVLALVETVHGADLHAIHIFATDAGLCDNVGHDGWIFLLSFDQAFSPPSRQLAGSTSCCLRTP